MSGLSSDKQCCLSGDFWWDNIASDKAEGLESLEYSLCMSHIWYVAETLTGVKYPCKKSCSCKVRVSSVTFWQRQVTCKLCSSLRQPQQPFRLTREQMRPREFLEEWVQQRKQQEGEDKSCLQATASASCCSSSPLLTQLIRPRVTEALLQPELTR